jgi:hypothetical protein
LEIGAEMMGPLASEYQTEAIVGIPGHHDYGSVQVHAAVLALPHETAYQLGVLIAGMSRSLLI